jgi:hypothetical protein
VDAGRPRTALKNGISGATKNLTRHCCVYREALQMAVIDSDMINQGPLQQYSRALTHGNIY